MSNSSLLKAKRERRDEYYTLYEDVEKEMRNYSFSGKTVYCPCDDFRWSNFVKYFRNNFHELGLNRLIASNYDIGEGAYVYMCDANGEYAFRVDGKGDYRDYNALRDEADIIVTNPPFSKWRDFFKWARVKDFILLGTLNVCGYKEQAPLIWADKIRMGWTHRGAGKITFATRDGGTKTLSSTVWLTTLPSLERPPLELTRRYTPEEYPAYDNYPDVINVNRTKDIPCDYDGLIGVPLSFLNYWNREQFEIVDGIGVGGYRGDGYVNGERVYSRLVIRRIKK